MLENNKILLNFKCLIKLIFSGSRMWEACQDECSETDYPGWCSLSR